MNYDMIYLTVDIRLVILNSSPLKSPASVLLIRPIVLNLRLIHVYLFELRLELGWNRVNLLFRLLLH